MATRSGDIDPTVPLYLQQHCGLSAADVDKLLNKQSGFQGLCGMTDLRAITTAGTPEAQTALDVHLTALLSPCYALQTVPRLPLDVWSSSTMTLYMRDVYTRPAYLVYDSIDLLFQTVAEGEGDWAPCHRCSCTGCGSISEPISCSWRT